MASTSFPSPAPVPPASDRAQLSAIDASTRSPVLVFLVFGALWLLASSVMALVSAVQLHNPTFLVDAGWLTYGRSRPAFFNALIYGWAFNAGFAVVLWLLARLAGSTLKGGSLALVGGLFWNVAVGVGVTGILIGDSTGYELMEMPGYASPLLLVAYALIGITAIATFRFGRVDQTYVSQWYILAALFWFPWFFSAAQLMLVFNPVRGTVQSIVAAWYGSNLFALWLAPLALASIYYFLPKMLGRSIHDYRLARMGFWSLVLFGSWAGARHLIGSPVPLWVQGAGTAGSLMLLIPLFVIGVNHFGTLSGRWGRLRGNPTLAFTAFAAAAFLVAGLAVVVTSLRSVAATTQFTLVSPALLQLELYGFFSMAMFGAVYYFLPRLLNREWPSAALITAHFWSSATGIVLVVVCLGFAGVLQGLAINDPEGFPNYTEVMARTVPFLVGHSLALVLLAIGHVAFVSNLLLMLFRPAPAPVPSPNLFRAAPALEVVR